MLIKMLALKMFTLKNKAITLQVFDRCLTQYAQNSYYLLTKQHIKQENVKNHHLKRYTDPRYSSLSFEAVCICARAPDLFPCCLRCEAENRW